MGLKIITPASFSLLEQQSQQELFKLLCSLTTLQNSAQTLSQHLLTLPIDADVILPFLSLSPSPSLTQNKKKKHSNVQNFTFQNLQDSKFLRNFRFLTTVLDVLRPLFLGGLGGALTNFTNLTLPLFELLSNYLKIYQTLEEEGSENMSDNDSLTTADLESGKQSICGCLTELFKQFWKENDASLYHEQNTSSNGSNSSGKGTRRGGNKTKNADSKEEIVILNDIKLPLGKTLISLMTLIIKSI